MGSKPPPPQTLVIHIFVKNLSSIFSFDEKKSFFLVVLVV